MVDTICWGSGSSFASSTTLCIDSETSDTDGFLVSDSGRFGVGCNVELGVAKRRGDSEPSEVFGVDLPLAPSLSRRERDVPRLSSEDVLGCSNLGVDGDEVSGRGGAFSPSFFFRAAARAANLESFPPLSGAPPKSPKRG